MTGKTQQDAIIESDFLKFKIDPNSDIIKISEQFSDFLNSGVLYMSYKILQFICVSMYSSVKFILTNPEIWHKISKLLKRTNKCKYVCSIILIILLIPLLITSMLVFNVCVGIAKAFVALSKQLKLVCKLLQKPNYIV